MKNVVAVRWLGSYTGGWGPLIESAKWELKAEREVAFAFMHPDGPRVGDSFVGLLVDVQRSTIRARYVGDAYTVLNQDGVTLRNTRSYEVRVKKGQTPRLAVCRSLGGENSYDEGVGFLKFAGVVVHQTAPKSIRKEAIQIAEAIGLPYLGSLSGNLKPRKPQERTQASVARPARPSSKKVPPPPPFRNLKVGVKSAKAILAWHGLQADGNFVVDREGMKSVSFTINGQGFVIYFYFEDKTKATYRLWRDNGAMYSNSLYSGVIEITPDGQYKFQCEDS